MNSTIVTTYGESCQVMEYMDDFCGCCRSRFYHQWYEENEAYFVKEGIFVIDDLMFIDTHKDVNQFKSVRYCFKFDFTEKTHSSFTILNYYNQEKVAEFKFYRKDNPDFKNLKVKIDFMDLKKFEKLGFFANTVIEKKINKSWDIFNMRNASLPKSKYKEAHLKQVEAEKKMYLEFMCEHTMEIIHSSMYYYTKQQPEQISYASYFGSQEDLEYTTKKETYIYKYTGYVNLNDSKIYRTKINKGLDADKRKDYDRHIESWTVRGHYRKVNGKMSWVKDHIKGEGVLEQRIYGTVPESDILLIPKLIECERDVRVSVKRKESTRDELTYADEPSYDLDDLMEINYQPEPIIKVPEPIKLRYTRWQRIKMMFFKIIRINNR